MKRSLLLTVQSVPRIYSDVDMGAGRGCRILPSIEM